MTEAINCPSCGAANQLPEGKTSMFCAFCGNSIQAVTKEKSSATESFIKTKPSISKKKTSKGAEYSAITDKVYKTTVIEDEGGELSLIKRDIKSLDEITVWFSDNELLEINKLTLNDNNINNLSGIERFENLVSLNLSNNKISELPQKDEFLGKIFRMYLGGNPIEKSISDEQKKYYSNIRFYTPRLKKILPKANIVGDLELRCDSLNIESISEITDLYNENELYEIKRLYFSKNKLKSLIGLSNFYAQQIDFSFNELIQIDDLPNFSSNKKEDINLDFRENNNLKDFSDSAASKINKAKAEKLQLDLRSCPQFNFESLSKINFNKLLQSADSIYSYITILTDNNVTIPNNLKTIGFSLHSSDNGYSDWKLVIKGNPVFKDNTPSFGKILGNELSGGKCFVATATMGSYDHPEVMVLRNFRDNWILEKSWGEAFVKWYYHYGAIAAKSIEKSFILKKICYLLIVKPLVYLTRIVK